MPLRSIRVKIKNAEWSGLSWQAPYLAGGHSHQQQLGEESALVSSLVITRGWGRVCLLIVPLKEKPGGALQGYSRMPFVPRGTSEGSQCFEIEAAALGHPLKLPITPCLPARGPALEARTTSCGRASLLSAASSTEGCESAGGAERPVLLTPWGLVHLPLVGAPLGRGLPGKARLLDQN